MKPMCLVNVAGCLVLGSGVFFGIWQWDWIVTGPTGEESGSTTLRNLGLVSGGFIAIWIAIWRGDVADRQAQASQEQARASLNQVEISRLSLLNERYQKRAEMLGSTALYVRLGGYLRATTASPGKSGAIPWPDHGLAIHLHGKSTCTGREKLLQRRKLFLTGGGDC